MIKGARLNQSIYQFNLSTKLCNERRKLWQETISRWDFGDIGFDWCDAFQRDGAADFFYLEIFKQETPQGLVFLHIVRDLDLTHYLEGPFRRALDWLAGFKVTPLKLDVAFIEIPSGNVTGLMLAEESMEDREEIAQAALGYLQKALNFSFLCLKSAGPESENELNLPLFRTSFLPNMIVVFEGESSFEEYQLRRFKTGMRRKIRRNQTIFAAAGGAIELVEDFQEHHFQEMFSLYEEVCESHQQRGNLPDPLKVSAGFFRHVADLPRPSRRAFIARINGSAVGFDLVVDSGKTMVATYSGLRYSDHFARAYFNLGYALFEYALAHQYERLDLGATVEDMKRRYGAKPHFTQYHFLIRNPLVRFAAKRLSREFGD